jgi:hypothetical protein
MGIEGKRGWSRVFLPRRIHHSAQQPLVSTMNAVKNANGQEGWHFIAGCSKVSNSFQRLGHEIGIVA